MSNIRDWVVTNALVIALALLALMTLLAGIQSVRIDGLQVRLPLIGTFGPRGLKTELADAQGIIADIKRVQELAEAEARAARNNEALALIELKETADEAREQIERSNLERARAFAAAGGVRPRQAGCPAGATAAAPADRGAQGGDGSGAVPELDDLRGQSLVTVFASDVEICTVNTSRLLAAQPWGVQLEARNREPVEPN